MTRYREQAFHDVWMDDFIDEIRELKPTHVAHIDAAKAERLYRSGLTPIRAAHIYIDEFIYESRS